MHKLLLILLLSSLAFALPSPAGQYAGTWAGMNSDGTIKIALASGQSPGEWTADVSFTLGDQEVKCKTVRVKVDGEKLDLAYEFNIGGLQATSTVTGKFDGTKLEGTYTTKSSEGAAVDQGTFKTTLAK
ncbi:MAG TPA: hypothetical protein VKW06_03315 [Candidatus Angelobacter sp.]|nr:hypothetical protein [Candidatus Angelobacter sp.]